MKAIIEQIKVNAKTGKTEGTLEFKIRGNGTLVKKWREIVKQTGSRLTPRLGWLRASSSDSKNFNVILPVFTHNTCHGEKIIAVDPKEVQKYLELDEDDIRRLTRRFLYPKPQPSRLKRMLLDRRALAEEYRQFIDSGVCRNQADVARHFGVSRAWVTMVMNTVKPNIMND